MLNVNRSCEPVVLCKAHGIGQLHQKEGNAAHVNGDLPLTDDEKSRVAVVHTGAIGIIDPCLAHGFNKFLLRNFSHAVQKHTAVGKEREMIEGRFIALCPALAPSLAPVRAPASTGFPRRVAQSIFRRRLGVRLGYRACPACCHSQA